MPKFRFRFRFKLPVFGFRRSSTISFMLRIVIADDHPIVREGLKLIIAKNADMKVAGEAADGQDLLDKIRHDPPDVILLDISMPGRSGLDVLKQVKTRWPKIRLLVLSHHPEDQYALRVLRAG